MLKDLLQEWDREETKPFLTRLKGRISRSKSLREKIIFCIYRLKIQKDKLEIVILRIKRRDREIFGKCIEAQMRKDEDRASVYANECHEIRKIFKVVFHCRLAVEQVILRLETVEIFSDIATSIVIPVNLVKETKTRLSGILPSMASQLGEVVSELEDMVFATGNVELTANDVSTLTEDAKVILEEVRTVVEARSKEVFPDLPEQSAPEWEPT